MIDPAPGGLDLSARSVTVSTVGLAPQIRMLAKEGLQVTLAVSLHCPDDELRDTLVPINNRYPIKEVLDAAWEYADVTGRRVSIEYALIKDINDQKWRAEMLANRLRGKLVHVNLIPLNPTPGSKWTASTQEDEDTFVETLRERGVAATVRDTRGRDIDGACGQLAATQPG
jgi:23S rRNA (adenine2503-C2)-methyltransferase